MVRLKHLATLHTDCAANGKRPYVALENLASWTGRLIRGTDLPVRAPSGTGMASVEPGDVLFGKLRPYLAKTWVVDRPALASTELMCMRPRAGVDSRWLGYTTMATPFVEWAVATSEGTKMPRTSWEKAGEYRPWVPSHAQQQAIADYLDTETKRIDTLITKKHRMIELLGERWRNLRRHAILRGLNPVRGGGLVEPWDEMNLGVLVELQRGHDLPSSHRVEGDVPVVSLGGVSGWHDVAIADGPGVITGRYGTIGEVFYVGEPYWPLNTTLYVRDFRGTHPRWVYHLLAAIPLDIDSQKSAVDGINRNVVGSLRISRPSVSTQRQLAMYLDKAEEVSTRARASLQASVDLLSERRKALIAATVAGELAVPADQG